MASTTLMTDYLLLQPGWLWLIVPLILFPLLKKTGWIRQVEQQVSVSLVRHPQANNYQGSGPGTKSSHYFLILICSGLMLLALAQPVRLGSPVTSTDQSLTSADLMLIIDTSVSMVLRDYQLDGQRVDRMTMTRILLDRFSKQFSGNRIGIVVLGSQPQILLPLSEDKALARHLIHRLKPTIAGRQAALGDALAVAAEFIKAEKQISETVMVLISDAASPSGKLSPIAGVERVAEAGIVLHTIAIGSKDMQLSGTAASQHGELIYEPADLKLLQQMAKLSGGEYFHAVDAAAMDAALKQIERRHQIKPETKPVPRLQQSLYIWPLAASILLMMLMALLPYRYSMD